MRSRNLLCCVILSLLLPHSCRADPSQNDSSISFNRAKRLSDAQFNEETLRLSNYVVSIRTRTALKYFGDNHFCTGVILSPLKRRIKYASRMLLIVAASVNRLKYIKHRTFVTPVQNIILPDNFTMVNKQDIGLLKLKQPLPRNNKYISVARLPQHPPEPGTLCLVMGWGRMFLAGPLASYMLHIDVKIIDSLKCAELLKVPIFDLLCAIDDNNLTAQQPCVGDWGSPLMHENTVYGIVSILVGCGSADLPSVYTDVYKNSDWIQAKISDDAGSTFSAPLLLVYFYIMLI
ncbi:thrombin-like enzyme BjussuSP-1 isoform X2 [Drosophila rhopaloa]|uniref:Peptidase S1 domain-containing protein n=1 Tax=Drosophila rhopaloa TaxID=1041015 RepID=A0ABM5J576_DRORH|nr:thrombin-like enzyme BjussuSP-1 isoform X2 [Drosophila rhopaloa]